MAGTDLKAERKDLYAPRLGVFVDVVVPPMTFLAIDGSGDPNVSEDYRHAIEALFSASYAAKFLSKRELHRDYVVLPLEGQWWAEDMAAFRTRDKARWSWCMMIRQPDWVGADVLSEVVRIAEEKGAVAASQLRPYTLDEGRCAQTLHFGSYDDEGPVLARLHDEYLPQHSLKPRGLHHEIYLSDALERRDDVVPLSVPFKSVMLGGEQLGSGAENEGREQDPGEQQEDTGEHPVPA